MSVTASTLVSASATPSDPTDVWEPLALLRADWSQPVRVETSWMTAVDQADSGAEQRTALQTRPVTSTSYLVSALDATTLATSRAWQRRRLQARTLAPLWSDRSDLTSAADSGATTIYCDTTCRRLHVGARVGLVPRGAGMATPAYQIAVVAGVADDALTVAAPGISVAAPAGTLVVPLLEAEVVLEADAGLITTAVGRMTCEAQEPPGPWCMEPLQTAGDWTAEDHVVDGLPVLDLADAWAAGLAADQARPGALHPAGMGTLARLTGRPAQRYSARIRCLTRAHAWTWLRRFHAARGRLQPMLALDPAGRLQPTAMTTTTLQVPARGSVHEWSERPLLYLRRTDGTAALRAITSVTRSPDGTTDTLTWAAAEPITGWTVAAIAIAGTAHRVRFAADSMSERWITDQACDIEIDLVEIHAEEAAAIADLSVVAGVYTGRTARPRYGWCFGVLPSDWTEETADDIRPAGATYYSARISGIKKAWSYPPAANDGKRYYVELMGIYGTNNGEGSIDHRAFPLIGLTWSLQKIMNVNSPPSPRETYAANCYNMEPSVDHTHPDGVWCSNDRTIGIMLDTAAKTITWHTPPYVIRTDTYDHEGGFFSVYLQLPANYWYTSDWTINTGQRPWQYEALAETAFAGLGLYQELPV